MNLTLTNSRWEMLGQTQSAELVRDLKVRFEEWLKTLGDPARMSAFAQTTIESMSDELRRAGVSPINTSKAKYSKAMAKGMKQGADALKKYLKNVIARKGMGGVPAGALHRMQLLKWV